MEFFFTPTQCGIKPSFRKQWQPVARLSDAGQLWWHTYGKFNTCRQTHSRGGLCILCVYDETLKAAVKVISGALTNEESMDHIAFGSPGRAPAWFWGLSTAAALCCCGPTYVWMQRTRFRTVWDCKEQQKSWKWVEWISRLKCSLCIKLCKDLMFSKSRCT